MVSPRWSSLSGQNETIDFDDFEDDVAAAAASATAAAASATAAAASAAAAQGYRFDTKADAIAATNLDDAETCSIDGYLYRYTATVPTHVATFQNAASGRRYVYAEPVFWQSAIDNSEVANGVINDAVTAAYALAIPLQLLSGSGALTINPLTDTHPGTGVAPTTNAERQDIIDAATDWIARCPTLGLGEIVLTFAGTTAIPVEGQVIWGDLNAPAVARPPLSVNWGYPEQRTISSISYGAKNGRVVFISVTGGGSGYSTAPTVTFSGGGGSGAAATAYIAGGAVIAVVMTNEGSGYTSAPTIGFTGGGGSGATATAKANTHIIAATINFTADRPSNCAVGMPVSFQDVAGDNDAGAMNCSAMISSLPGTLTQIVVEITAPRATTLASPTTVSAGICNFPLRWLEVQGGYTGSVSGREAYWNASGVNLVKLSYPFMCWRPLSQTQGAKTNQSGIHTGALGGTIHVVDIAGICNFPLYGIRLNGAHLYLNYAHTGGGICGNRAVTIQGTGHGQIVQSSFGSSLTQGVTIGRGCQVNMSACHFGASSECLNIEGGDVDYSTCSFHGSTYGVNCDYQGRGYGGASATIDRCTTGIYWANGGRVVHDDANVTNSITAAGRFPVNSEALGGYWLDSESTQVQRRYLTSTVFIGQGIGSPESAVTAGIGSMWLQTDATAGALWIKQSGAGSTGWVQAFQSAAAGSVSAPAFTWSGDPDTGFYNAAANQIGMAIGGVQAMLASAGLVTWGPASGAGTGYQVTVRGESGTGLEVNRYSTDASGATIGQRKARGTIDAPAVVVNGDAVSRIEGYAYNSSAFTTVWREAVAINETTPGTGSMGARWSLHLTAPATVTLTEYLRLDGASYLQLWNGAAFRRVKTDSYAAVATDAAFTLTPVTDAANIRHTGTLTADRTITLSTTNAYAGATFRVTRTGSGAFNLSVGGLKNLATNSWAEVVYDGSAWYLAAYGTL